MDNSQCKHRNRNCETLAYPILLTAPVPHPDFVTPLSIPKFQGQMREEVCRRMTSSIQVWGQNLFVFFIIHDWWCASSSTEELYTLGPSFANVGPLPSGLPVADSYLLADWARLDMLHGRACRECSLGSAKSFWHMPIDEDEADGELKPFNGTDPWSHWEDCRQSALKRWFYPLAKAWASSLCIIVKPR